MTEIIFFPFEASSTGISLHMKTTADYVRDIEHIFESHPYEAQRFAAIESMLEDMKMESWKAGAEFTLDAMDEIMKKKIEEMKLDPMKNETAQENHPAQES